MARLRPRLTNTNDRFNLDREATKLSRDPALCDRCGLLAIRHVISQMHQRHSVPGWDSSVAAAHRTPRTAEALWCRRRRPRRRLAAAREALHANSTHLLAGFSHDEVAPSWRNDSLKSRISGHGGTQRLFLPQTRTSNIPPARRDGIAMADKAALCLISAKDLAALSLARFISTKICSSVGLQKVCSS